MRLVKFGREAAARAELVGGHLLTADLLLDETRRADGGHPRRRGGPRWEELPVAVTGRFRPAGARISRRDHHRDALRGELCPVDVDSGDVTLLAIELLELPLPAVRDRVGEGRLRRGKQRGRVIVQVGAEVLVRPLPKLGLHAGRHAHHKLHIEQRLDALALLVGCPDVLGDLVVAGVCAWHLVLKELGQVLRRHVLALELSDGLPILCAFAIDVWVVDRVGRSNHRGRHLGGILLRREEGLAARHWQAV
mmetsp:Transcript_49866/g.115116  ORF Transcript_49866/g.115116 Transcript_49866/m.115116 type:complete len:250 (+) Transcript_49866:265-1014(+)